MSTTASSQTYDAIVLGAGASGLYCAMTAAGRGRRVLVIDHAAEPGRKLSITGGGKCNLSNRAITPEDYVGENPDFCRSALSRFTPAHILDFAAAAKIPLEEREHGQIFCARPAREVARFLASRCEQNGCATALEEKILAVEPVQGIRKDGGPRFCVRTSRKGYMTRSVVVATGGPAWPQIGATGSGYAIARAFGHRIVPIRPALCGLIMPNDWPLAGLSGISLAAAIRVDAVAANLPAPGKTARGKPAPRPPAADSLPLLFTHRGLSGPAALQTSLYWRKGDVLQIDFLPASATDSLLDAPNAGKALCRTILRRHIPERLCDALLPKALGMKKTAEMSRGERDLLAGLVHRHRVRPSAPEGFARAEVTAGGVCTREISSRSMESGRVPGLFFCGEVLDVTGRLGGYNLHWAFASGKAAGEAL